VALKYVNPPTSMFMVKRKLEGLVREDRSWKIHCQWVDRGDISLHIAPAAVASEDQKFLTHGVSSILYASREFLTHRTQ